MRALIIYDSQYGNTEKIARAISQGIDDSLVLSVDKLIFSRLAGVQLLVVGSPTQGGQPTVALQEFIKRMPPDLLIGKKIATFDTRYAKSDHGWGLRLLMSVIDFAAPRIASLLQTKGGQLIAPPEGFIVTNKDGPLKPGELERAEKWGQVLNQK